MRIMSIGTPEEEPPNLNWESVEAIQPATSCWRKDHKMIHSCKKQTESSFAAMSEKGQAYHLTWCGATPQVTQQVTQQAHETADCPIAHPGKKHTQWKISKKSSKKAKTSKKSSKKASSSELLDKNGKPLKGAALAKRHEKLAHFKFANAPASDTTPAYIRENADLGLRGANSTSSHPGRATARAAAKPSGLSEDSVKNLIREELAEYSAHAQREAAERHDKLEDKLEAILSRMS